MWPFSRGKDGHASKKDGVESIPGVAQSKFFDDVQSGEETHFGGKASGVAVSEIDRAREMHYVLNKGDYRVTTMDPESISCLMTKYGKEIDAADELMRKKLSNQKYYEVYDYENDKRFQQWKKDREAVQERLQVHWIDNLIDRPTILLVYYLRVAVVAGAFYGLGRTAYLYRTMDKMYAKLNGVTVGKIGFHELTFAIAKGGIVATVASLGIVVGNVMSALLSVAMSKDVHVPERAWWHVMNCGAMSGLFAGAAFAGMHYKTFTRKAMAASVVAFTGVGAAVGGYYGYSVYRPYAAARTHRLYDAYWRPWNERRMKVEGPGNIRGRYV